MKMTRTQPGRKCKQEGPTGQSLITTPQKQQTRPKPLKHEETEMRRHVMLIQKRNVTVKVKVYFIKKYQEKNTAGSSKKDLSRDIEVRFGNALKSTVPIRSSYQVSTLGSKRYDTVALEAHGAHDQAPARIGDLQLEQLQAHS